jgi:hypothetical protein
VTRSILTSFLDFISPLVPPHDSSYLRFFFIFASTSKPAFVAASFLSYRTFPVLFLALSVVDYCSCIGMIYYRLSAPLHLNVVYSSQCTIDTISTSHDSCLVPFQRADGSLNSWCPGLHPILPYSLVLLHLLMLLYLSAIRRLADRLTKSENHIVLTRPSKFK